VHELKWPRGKKLNVGSHRIHDAKIPFRLPVIPHIFVGEFSGRITVSAAGRKLHGFPLVQLRGGTDVGMDIDDHSSHRIIVAQVSGLPARQAYKVMVSTCRSIRVSKIRKRHRTMGSHDRRSIVGPNDADAHSNLGFALVAQGRIDNAIAHFQQALALNPDRAEVHNNLGAAMATHGQTTQAIAHYQRAVFLNPDYADAYDNLGVALATLGRTSDAIAHYQRALAIRPRHANTHSNLGLALAAQGRIVEAVAHYQVALGIQPDHANAHTNLGLALAAQGRTEEAIVHLERAVVLNPRHPATHSNLGVALATLGRTAAAIVHYRQALTLNPDYADAHNNLGVALAAQGRAAEAIAHYQRALAIRPDHAGTRSNLGTALADQGRIADAIAHLERALLLDPNHADAHNNLGRVLRNEGRFDEAVAHYDRAIAIRPDYGEAYLNRAQIKSFHRGDADLAALEELAAGGNLRANKAVYIHFALAKALEDTKDYSRALEHLHKGNVLKRGQIQYDEAAALARFWRIAKVFDAGLFHRFQGAGDSSPVPVFVLGMPRSGSTLIEQILASHPQIQGAGELTDFETAAQNVLKACHPAAAYPECVPALDHATPRRIGRSYLERLPALADGQMHVVDKLPGNFLHIGLIRLVLPNAKIIHTMRHPIDTCVSCYSKLFTSGHHYAYDLAELGRFYRGYSELMSHWRSVLPPGAMLEVSYEDVVSDLESQARRLIDYCGLPWDDRCLSFHKTARTVRTASAVQVRQPLFRSSLERWRRYQAGIAPLLDELAPILSLLRR
jgi:tetratricopeptide (TPR) repeat protein